MKIFIPLETASREILYKVFLSINLAKSGFKCYLGSKYNINKLVQYESDFLYIDKGFHKGQSEELYDKILKNNGKIISLDEEGAIDFEDGSTLLGRYSKHLFNNSKMIFLWGEEQLKIIKKNIFNLKNVHVTGHPRFELLKTQYHYLYKKESDRIKKKYGEFILINTNMSFGNNILGDAFIRKNYGSRFKKINELIFNDKIKLNIILELVELLAKKLKTNIVLRPHPEEDLNYYQKLFKSYENVSILNKGSVIPWIISSSNLIHTDCTTAIECAITGKQPISILPKDCDLDLITFLPIKISKCFNDIELVYKHILDSNEKSNKTSNEKMKLIDNYFSFNKNSNDEIVSKILKIFRVDLNSKKLTYKSKTFFFFKNIQTSIFRMKKINPLSKQKLKGFNHKKILEISNNIKKNNSTIKDVKIEKLNEFLYSFDSKI